MFQSGAPRAKKPESKRVHEAAVYLRKMGYRVLRSSGSQSVLDGHLIDNRDLPAIAARVAASKAE